MDRFAFGLGHILVAVRMNEAASDAVLVHIKKLVAGREHMAASDAVLNYKQDCFAVWTHMETFDAALIHIKNYVAM